MKSVRILGLTLALLFMFSTVAEARIDLVPRKVVIQGRDKSGEITVLNLADEDTTFRVELINLKQDENGTYKTLDAPLNPAFDPKDVVRLSPRKFTLPPGGRQKIRFALRVPPDLPDGEYRFHLETIEISQPSKDNGPAPFKGANITIKTNLGVSIPVVYRRGDLQASAKISNVTLVSADKTESKKPEVQMRIERSGNASSMGVLYIMWEAPGAEPKKIGSISNMNLFTEIKTRSVKVPIEEIPSGPGVIRVRYFDDLNKNAVFDELVLQK